MEQIFGAESTTDEVLEGRDLAGKRVLVTGVSAGLGVETARALVARGAEVVGTARDISKAKAATQPIDELVRRKGAFEVVELDLANLASVRAGADALVARNEPFDIVIANAGVMATPFGHTSDGFETQFGTNHLGHFVFINRIAPLLLGGARVIVLASSGHRFSDVNLDDPNFEHTPYDPFAAYGRSKTANMLFAVAFDRRHKERGVRAASVHPGPVMTELGRHMDQAVMRASVDAINKQLAAEGKPSLEFKTIPQGAATSVWAAVVAQADAIGGRYCENCHVSDVVPDDLPLTPVSEGVRAYALDPERAEALWIKSEQMVGTRF